MRRFLCLGFLLLLPFLSLGCGSSTPEPPKLDDSTISAINAEDASVDQAEEAQ